MKAYVRQAGVVVMIAQFLVSTGMAAQEWKVESRGKATTVIVRLADAGQVADYPAGRERLYYEVAHEGETTLSLSPLGITRSDQGFVDGLTLVEAGRVRTVDERYTLLHGKQLNCRNHANERVLKFENADGARVELIVRAYDDGAAFRYRFPDEEGDKRTVVGEQTGFRLPAGSQVWAHPYDEATKYTPAYETYYVDGLPAGTPSPNQAGWAFPLLFQTVDGERWALITEAGLDDSYCGSRLRQAAPYNVYRLRFPDEAEGNHTGAVQPSSTLPWATPWRVVIVGDSLGDLVESTLVTDVSEPSTVQDTSWIRPGRASWSWLYDHDSPQDFDKLKQWIDLAAEMGWEYSLVDANWTIMKNGTIHELIEYAESKDVALLLWVNSGGPHNYVSEKPRGLMYFPEIRREELKRWKDWGIKGIKVDFFQSDKQNVIRLYHEILRDAAEFEMMVNFHGCTLPRGWSRTYPHLMTMEAVRGEECYSFDKRFTEEAPVHNVILPFTRNVVGPMDYTPVMFADNVYPHLTTYAHELALPIVFESAWLHFADGVRQYLDLPETPKRFLKGVPVVWDETKFLAGHPGRYVVLTRRHGGTWYVGGISGERTGRELDVNLDFLGRERYAATLIADGQDARRFETDTRTVTARDRIQVRLLPYGGFTVMLKPIK